MTEERQREIPMTPSCLSVVSSSPRFGQHSKERRVPSSSEDIGPQATVFCLFSRECSAIHCSKCDTELDGWDCMTKPPEPSNCPNFEYCINVAYYSTKVRKSDSWYVLQEFLITVKSDSWYVLQEFLITVKSDSWYVLQEFLITCKVRLVVRPSRVPYYCKVRLVTRGTSFKSSLLPVKSDSWYVLREFSITVKSDSWYVLQEFLITIKSDSWYVLQEFLITVKSDSWYVLQEFLITIKSDSWYVLHHFLIVHKRKEAFRPMNCSNLREESRFTRLVPRLYVWNHSDNLNPDHTDEMCPLGRIRSFTRSCSPVELPSACLPGINKNTGETIQACYTICDRDGCNADRSFHHLIDLLRRRRRK
ncbi:hypothetical protein LSH36_207g07072 [Paralvinella palmiformis]|uniref:Uncharacterized protein n=1 Tax=Paralvinella palmiformis TaxID=53620 RepID=A0AAD9JPU7_9ANNE|nr:hypothetical protein LSH36_207g07072 [Paralvinella palmiformis]